MSAQISDTQRTKLTIGADGSISAASTRSFKPLKISSRADAETRFASLQRLESNFRSMSLAMRDATLFKNWTTFHGYDAAVECLDSIRFARMASNTYDKEGIHEPGYVLTEQMRNSKQDASPTARFEIRPITSPAMHNEPQSRDQRSPAAKQSSTRVPAFGKPERTAPANHGGGNGAIIDACKQQQYCLAHNSESKQCSLADANGFHTIKPRKQGAPAFDVQHKCIKCHGSHPGGYFSCPEWTQRE